MSWLPAEPEKVEFFEEIGLPLRLIPRRIYCGMVGNQKRYFALKLPLAVDPKNRHLCLRRSGPPDGYRTLLAFSSQPSGVPARLNGVSPMLSTYSQPFGPRYAQHKRLPIITLIGNDKPRGV